MGLDKNLSDALDVEYTQPVEVKPQQVTVYEPEPEEPSYNNDATEDYKLARKVLRNLIEKGNDAIDEISSIARQQESARGFEVVSNLIKTVSDTTKDLYQLQKMTKDLKEPSPDSDPRKKGEQGNINVEQAVFVGSAAELLAAMKKTESDENTV